MAIIIMPATAQKLKNPDEATWAITGNMQSSLTGGKTTYELLNPQGSNGRNGYITFKKETHHFGNTVEGEQVVFSLQNAKTDRPNNFRGEMVFWSWNDEAGEWQIDIESGSGRSEYESATYINFMLVLDCSGSMGAGSRDVKNSAKFFLNRMLEVSGGKGNVRVGVIGFSTVEYSKNHTIAPLPLTQDNYSYLCNYIEELYSGGGTALWYSMNAAAECLQQDYEKNLRGKRFAGSSVVAFTDGHDNTSNDKDKGYSSSKDYYNKYFKIHYPQQKVKDMKIETWIVGKRGEDITSDNIWSATESQFKAMADEYIPIRNMSELHSKFEDIANNLIERNTVLNLRVAEGISGRVGWTFPEEKIEIRIPTMKTGKFWLGLGLEVGNSYYEQYVYDGYYYDYYGNYVNNGYYEYYSSIAFALRADAAWPLCSWFALGATVSFGWGASYPVYRLGLMNKFTFSKGSALLFGVGIQNWCDETYPYFGLGWKFRSPWYINANVNMYGSVSFGVGYSIFGGKNNK